LMATRPFLSGATSITRRVDARKSSIPTSGGTRIVMFHRRRLERDDLAKGRLRPPLLFLGPLNSVCLPRGFRNNLAEHEPRHFPRPRRNNHPGKGISPRPGAGGSVPRSAGRPEAPGGRRI